MKSLRHITAVLLLILSSEYCCAEGLTDTAADAFLRSYCIRCHGGDGEVNGDINFTEMDSDDAVNSAYDTWETAVELIATGKMPPPGEPQPSAEDKQAFTNWYSERFINDVTPHPGFFRPRRLSAREYRNTLETLFGFELNVAIIEAEQTVSEKSLVIKLLPTDPPGPSGFTNDTSTNPLTATIWDQYSYLADFALEKLFSQPGQTALEEYTGAMEGGDLSALQAQELLSKFLLRASRRRRTDDVQTRMLDAINGLKGAELESAVRKEMKTILMSPAFLYRGLLAEFEPNRQQPVDQFELAERLSYFLWADMPDDELLELAERGQLNNPETLAHQTDRLLASPQARSLAEIFGVQWFSLREIEKTSNNPPIAEALVAQPIDFLNYLFTEDRPVMELIDSHITFINPHTAKYYPRDRQQMTKYRKQKGIEVQAVPNQKIELLNTVGRGGLLTMPGILAMNRGPVLRGAWILERILGDHLPEPPPDVGQVPGNRNGESLTFRQRFELHRSNPTCAVCHDRIDPLGFALQAYGPGGTFDGRTATTIRRRKSERDDSEPVIQSPVIDTSGRLTTGETFQSFEELKNILLTSRRQQVVRTVVKRMMSYALCRRLQYYDRPTIDSIVDDIVTSDGTYRHLIHRITTSLPFRESFVRAD